MSPASSARTRWMAAAIRRTASGCRHTISAAIPMEHAIRAWVHSFHLAAVLAFARRPEVAVLVAAQVRAAVGRHTAGAHGVLHARVDGAGVSAIRVTHAIGHGDERSEEHT